MYKSANKEEIKELLKKYFKIEISSDILEFTMITESLNSYHIEGLEKISKISGLITLEYFAPNTTHGRGGIAISFKFYNPC